MLDHAEKELKVEVLWRVHVEKDAEKKQSLLNVLSYLFSGFVHTIHFWRFG